MDSKLIDFLEDIKKDFCWYLYSLDYKESEELCKSKNINFPFCCLFSAQLISSFLYVHFSEDTLCIYDIIKNGRGYGHAWSELEDKVIDFTHIQFTSKRQNFSSEYKLNRDMFDRIIDDIPIIYEKSEHEYAKYEMLEDNDWDDFRKEELLAVKYAQKYPPTKDGFMEYLNEAVVIAKDCVYY